MLGAKTHEDMRMKPALLGLSLLLMPLASHAAIDNSARQDIASAAAAARPAQASTQQAAPDAASGEPEAASPRRSVLIREKGTGAPVLKFSATYRVVGLDQSARDNCRTSTGTHIKRDSDGIGACAIGNGRVYVPEW
jgi:hypothetical protein